MLGNPPYTRVRSVYDANSLYLNFNIPSPSNTNVYLSPWGNPSTQAQPMKLLQVAQAGLSKTWAMVDADKTLMDKPPAPAAPFKPGWYSKLPDKPVFGKMRAFLFFDWSVRAVPVGSNP